MPLSRRRLLGGLGGSLLAGSFCDLLVRPARAGALPTAKRLVILYTPDGTYPEYWGASGSASSISIEAGSILEPLAPHKDDLILLDGMSLYSPPAGIGCQHAFGMGSVLTNVMQDFDLYNNGDGGFGTATNGMSLDQYVASIVGTKSRFRSLELGVQTNIGSYYTDDAYTRIVYGGPGIPIPSDDNPAHVYSRLFDALLSEDDRLLRRRKSLIDLAYGDLTDLKSRLSTAQQSKLDLHLQAFEDIERSWEGELLCTPPTAPEIDQFSTNAYFADVANAQMDLLVSSLACGMTNVASLQFSQSVSEMVMTWLGHTSDWHSLSHAYSTYSAHPVEEFVQGQRWFSEQVAYLLDRLKSFPDPEVEGATLMDTTLVLWVHEFADGRTHTFEPCQYVIAGGANGRWTTGAYHDFGGTHHAHMLISICRAMGIDIDTFGYAEAGTGPLGVLS